MKEKFECQDLVNFNFSEKIKSFCLFCLTHVFLVLLLQLLRAGNFISFLVISYTYMCVRIFGHIYLILYFFNSIFGCSFFWHTFF